MELEIYARELNENSWVVQRADEFLSFSFKASFSIIDIDSFSINLKRIIIGFISLLIIFIDKIPFFKNSELRNIFLSKWLNNH